MASSSEDEVMNNAEPEIAPDSDDDLFGDDDDAPVQKTRELSDRDLDSGDDEERIDRAPRAEAEEMGSDSGRDARVMDVSVWRHPIPKPFDGQYDALRLPNFLGIDPLAFDPDTFTPPVSDHHSDTKSSNFLASAVSSSTMRYRTSPTTGKLESNANLYRWSDGSTTISIGDKHYELQTKPLVPPKDSKAYNEVQDSHQYLASPSIASQLLTMVGHMTHQHTVRPPPDIQDDALEKLQKSLAAATRGGHKDDKNGPEIISNTQDPELQKKRAEIAEKERLRAQRRRETAAEKANQPRISLGGRGGLNVDDLEGRSGRRPQASRKAPRRKNDRTDYDSDDDVPRGGRNREDEYDKDDGFLASSDEDLEEGGEGDDDEEEEEILEDEDDRPSKRQKTSKPKPDETSDADADADLDDEEAPAQPVSNEPASRGRTRNIIEDDDDDE